MEQIKKTKTVIFNTKAVEIEQKELTFKEVVTYALGSYKDEVGVAYTVNYTLKEDKKKRVLPPDDSVHVKDGMQFYVTESTKS